MPLHDVHRYFRMISYGFRQVRSGCLQRVTAAFGIFPHQKRIGDADNLGESRCARNHADSVQRTGRDRAEDLCARGKRCHALLVGYFPILVSSGIRRYPLLRLSLEHMLWPDEKCIGEVDAADEGIVFE